MSPHVHDLLGFRETKEAHAAYTQDSPCRVLEGHTKRTQEFSRFVHFTFGKTT